MENRMISLERNTNETQIDLTLDLDGSGRYEIDTGCGFLNHMLELFARHGRFDLVLTCHGDVEVDYHHTTEDIGIALGQAFAKALGEMRGIRRYGSFTLPMDEALILCAVDISGRCTLNWDVHCKAEKVGDFDVECVQEFWLGFARNLPGTVHFVQFAGENTHHILEDLNRVKFSLNPYNINRLTLKAGEAALNDTAYFDKTRAAIIETRAWTKQQLEARGFTCLDSRSNFLFASTERKNGAELYKKLKEKGVLVRHFDAPRIANWLRVTIGTPEEMQALLAALDKILEE